MVKYQNAIVQGLVVAIISVVINTIFIGLDNFNFRESFIAFVVIAFVYTVLQYFFFSKKGNE